MAFTHIFPGVVRTNNLSGSDDWKIRMFSPLTFLVGRVGGVTAEACGEYMWRGLYASRAGWCRMDNHGEVMKVDSLSSELRSKVWDHTLEVTSAGKK
jgi:hypothetical protein